MISEQASERTGVLSVVRLAWFLWASAVALVALGAVLLALNRNVEDPIAPYWINLAATALALSTVGALVASKRPENPDLQLVEDAGDVVAHRLRAQGETGRDLRIAQALGYEVEDLALPVGELGEGPRGQGASPLYRTGSGVGPVLASPSPGGKGGAE